MDKSEEIYLSMSDLLRTGTLPPEDQQRLAHLYHENRLIISEQLSLVVKGNITDSILINGDGNVVISTAL